VTVGDAKNHGIPHFIIKNSWSKSWGSMAILE